MRGCSASGIAATILLALAVCKSPVGLAQEPKAILQTEECEEPPEPFWEIKLWDLATGREKVSLSGETGQILSIAFSPDGKLLATGDCDNLAFSSNGAVRLWDVQALLKARR